MVFRLRSTGPNHLSRSYSLKFEYRLNRPACNMKGGSETVCNVNEVHGGVLQEKHNKVQLSGFIRWSSMQKKVVQA